MKKTGLLLFVITLQVFTAIAQTSAEQLKDDFIRTYNPDGYDGYHSALDVRDQGLSLVSSLKNGLNQNQGLTESFNPSVILNDFNLQIQNIESLEANFNKETNSYDFNAGQSIGNSFSSGNFEQGMNEVFGYLGGLEGRNQARREVAENKASLRRERDSKMKSAYWKAQDYNNQTILEYVKAAAFAENLAEEKHFYSYVINLQCFSKSMESKFSTTNTYWLNNKCPKPIKNEFSGIENNFVTKEVQYLNIAKRKYKRFNETGYEDFRDAAIAYTAAVIDAKPSAKLFVKLGDYYVGKSNVLALTNYLAAQSYDKEILKGETLQNFELVKTQTTEDIKVAIETNNKIFLNTFLSSNLDKTVSINGKSILNYAIKLDQPDAVQIILNKYIKDKSQAIVQNKLQKTIMMCAVYDASKTIQRFIDLGFPADFEMKGFNPIDVAAKYLCKNAYTILLENSDNKEKHLQKHKNSPINIILIGEKDPVKAGQLLDANTQNAVVQKVVTTLISESLNNTYYYYILGNSKKARELVNTSALLKNKIQEKLIYEISEKETGDSKAADIISSGILEYSQVPTLGELLPESEYPKFSMSVELDFVLDSYNKSINSLNNIAVSQYYTQETKNQGISGIQKELTRFNNIKSALPNVTETQKEETRTAFLIVLGSSVGNLDLKREYYNFYIKNLKNNYNYSLTEKLNIQIEYYENLLLELDQETQKVSYDAIINLINIHKKNIENVDDLSSSVIHALNKVFPTFLLTSRKELDAESLRYLLLESYVQGESNYLVNQNSIAFIAFKKKDAKLFKAIDKHYELNKAFNSDGTSLLLNILNEGLSIRTADGYGALRKIKVEKAYLSKDFNFNEKIGSDYPIEILLQNAPKNILGQIEDFFTEDLKDIEGIYNVDFNKYYAQLNGTILHWYVSRLIEESEFYYKPGLGEFIKTLNIDKSIVNDQNLTAYKLYVKNKGGINKKIQTAEGFESSASFLTPIFK